MKLNIIPKASIADISPHVNAREFACNCNHDHCRFTLYSEVLIERFEELRYNCGSKPITITSAFRCHDWNRDPAVGGLPKSKHIYGLALDMLPPEGMSVNEFAKRAWGFFDVVIAYKKFIHCHLNTSIL